MRSIRTMKRGTVSVRYEKVRHRGNPEPVLRGPYGLFVRQEGGHSVGRRLHSPAEIAQAREEVAAYERFQGLGWGNGSVRRTPRKRPQKKAPVAVEREAEVTRIVRTAIGRGDYDLEALELALRQAALGQAAQALGALMNVVGKPCREAPVTGARCAVAMRGTGPRTKGILTILDEVSYTRSRYRCPQCGAVRYPGDETLGLTTK